MMHGPCGNDNPHNSCMTKKGLRKECKNHFPKAFSECTTIGKNSYPIYRRRDTKEKVKVRGFWLDNRWVIPYNSYLLAKI